MHCLQIVFADEKNNGFCTLGGACWETFQERDRRFAEIPVSDGSDGLILDKLNEEGERIEEKLISTAWAEFLLNDKIGNLIERARVNTCFTLEEYEAKNGLI